MSETRFRPRTKDCGRAFGDFPPKITEQIGVSTLAEQRQLKSKERRRMRLHPWFPTVVEASVYERGNVAGACSRSVKVPYHSDAV